ncbi:MAG: HMA2 domain-containing protein, partial [Intestinibacter sp.]
IKYEEETIQPMLIIGIILKVLGLEDEAHSENKSLVTKESIDILDSLSHTIYEKTNGILDLKSSVMLLLGTYAVYDIKTRPGVRPAGITCLWWLYGLINRPN